MYTAVLHILCDVDSMDRAGTNFTMFYSLQYGEVTHVQAVKTGNVRIKWHSEAFVHPL
jgi:hypothetical protein